MSTNEIQTPHHARPPRNLRTKAIIALAIAAGVVVWGVVSRMRDTSALEEVKKTQAIPVVNIVHPVHSQSVGTLTLPGSLQAFYSAAVYARVNGYLKHWYVDIGAVVKAGQVLADIETPELDQQLVQAEADLDTALANEKLTEITSARWQNLLKSDSVSQQEADEKSGDYAAKKALMAAARAEVERLRVLESFKRITAPFSGVVTDRKTDIGALINAGHDAGHELFTVADVHKLRLYVEVPQNYSEQIHVGMKARLEVPEHPGKTFDAVLSDNSRAVNTASDTVLIQLDVDNSAGTLMPGEYGTVRFDLPPDLTSLQIPASALRFQKNGLTVAVLGPDNRVQIRALQISRDLGATVEFATGLSASDSIIDNPPDSMEEGDQVSVAQPTEQGGGGAK